MRRRLRVASLVLLASCALPAVAQAQAAGATGDSVESVDAAGQRSSRLLPRKFATVRVGPVGRTTVRAHGRVLAGSPVAAPGLGARFDLPLNEYLLLGVDFGALFESEDRLGPPQSSPYAEQASIDGFIGDLVLGVRRVWQPDPGRLELYLSIGAGVSWRAAFSGAFPRAGEVGATDVEAFRDTAAWGVLAQAGMGGTLWLSQRVGVFVELLALARQVNAVIADPARGDYLMQINDANALLIMGVGATFGGRR